MTVDAIRLKTTFFLLFDYRKFVKKYEKKQGKINTLISEFLSQNI